MSATEQKCRVVIGAREAALRVGMRLALEETAECTEAGGPAAMIDAIGRTHPDVCFLDMDRHGGGIRATGLIRRLQPDAQVVLMSRTPTEEEFLQAIRAGAAGYLPESINLGRLPHIVEGVINGEAAVPRMFVRRLFDEVRNVGRRSIVRLDSREVTLTRREAEVLDLLRDGLATHAIARRLGISDVTVRRHRSTLFTKLDVASRKDLIDLLDARPSTGHLR